jgi:hypothetical protein
MFPLIGSFVFMTNNNTKGLIIRERICNFAELF